MKNLLLISVIFLAVLLSAKAQTTGIYPKITISEQGKEYPLKLSSLDIEVSVTGNIAVTTYKMEFLNAENRILEGELEFPLGDGQMVSRFAMEVNGKLREGVVVEKAKGRETFEKIVRRGIDPGLLEQTAGNVFRSRVYPIPANGIKRIVIAYEQELLMEDDKALYLLPLQFESKISKFSLNIEVLKQEFRLSPSQNQITNLSFNNWNEVYSARASFTDYCPNQQLAIEIPRVQYSENVYYERFGEDSSYFYFVIKPEKRIKDKALPKSVCVLWDASSSGSNRNLEKELDLLESYLRKIENLEVKLVVFRNNAELPVSFKIKEGNCQALTRNIKKIYYDGGTQLGSLDLTKINTDEFLLFTDGMSNFGESELIPGNKPVFVINSNLVADHSYLRYIATASGGKFINLNATDVANALKELLSLKYQFISAKYLSGTVFETYPSLPGEFASTFSMAGKMKGNEGSLVLNFGIGSTVIYSDTIHLKPVNTGAAHVSRIWAQKTIAELDMRYIKNKNLITAIGKQYGIVTRNTSLIVLDRLEDYVENEIIPPDEMKADYFALLNNKKVQQEKARNNQIESVVQQFEDRKEWWNRKPASFIRPVVRTKRTQRNRNNTYTFPLGTNYPDNGTVTNGGGLNAAPCRISGKVVDISTGEPLPGVNIVVKGTTNGTVTDMEGKYMLNIPSEATLVFTYIGYKTEETTTGYLTVIDAALTLDMRELQEVVVTGYGTRRRNRAAAENKSYEANDAESSDDSEGIPGAIVLNAWDPQTPYIVKLKQVPDELIYPTYLELKKEYSGSPSFYLDVANYFEQNGEKDLALRILSNIAELQTENHQLLRVLGHRLQQLGYLFLAEKTFRRVLEIREEEPQSYRDLALALADNNKTQEAIDILYGMITKSWNSRFPGIELIAVGEMNNIIANTKKKPDLSAIDPRLLANLPVDIRVVLNWDADNCDMDLWVTSPDGEKCFYGNKTTQTGGQMSNDFTGGYGPEEFMIKKAISGNYVIEINYFGNHQQKLTGPTTVQVELYTQYGTRNQRKQEITLRLEDSKEVVKVGELNFDN